jgi:hypothetical protein
MPYMKPPKVTITITATLLIKDPEALGLAAVAAFDASGQAKAGDAASQRRLYGSDHAAAVQLLLRDAQPIPELPGVTWVEARREAVNVSD